MLVELNMRSWDGVRLLALQLETALEPSRPSRKIGHRTPRSSRPVAHRPRGAGLHSSLTRDGSGHRSVKAREPVRGLQVRRREQTAQSFGRLVSRVTQLISSAGSNARSGDFGGSEQIQGNCFIRCTLRFRSAYRLVISLFGRGVGGSPRPVSSRILLALRF